MSKQTARETAFLQLYALSQGGECGYEEVRKLLAEETEAAEKKPSRTDMRFAGRLTGGVMQAVSGLDEQITAHATNWSIERISWVDRCILRLAAYEMMYCEDIPCSVSINEAVELSKTYGGEKSAAFVNGVLGGLFRAITSGESVSEETEGSDPVSGSDSEPTHPA